MPTDFPLFPEAASTIAGEVDALYLFLVAMAGFFTLLIAGLIIAFVARYRRRAPDQVGSSFYAHTGLEIAWSVVPLVIVLFVFFWGAKVFFSASRPPADALEMYGIGKQWMWKFQHPEGNREINTLHVPTGQPIKLTLISQDVIHSLFVPSFRIKTDVLPGRYTTLWFEATKPGTYHLFCAEYCGTEHSRMIGWVVVQEPEAYEAWLAGDSGPRKSPVEAGQDLFASLGCQTCHLAAGGGRGPSLVNIAGSAVQLSGGATVTADDAYLRESILQPAARLVAGYQPVMPSFQGQISEESLLQLIAFIKSLSTPPSEGAAVAAPPAASGESAS